MPLVRLTAEEKAWLERERRRIALDATDWASMSLVTKEELWTMSPHVAARILDMGWEDDQWCQILRNPRHPDNGDFIRQLEHMRWHQQKMMEMV